MYYIIIKYYSDGSVISGLDLKVSEAEPILSVNQYFLPKPTVNKYYPPVFCSKGSVFGSVFGLSGILHSPTSLSTLPLLLHFVFN